MGQPDEGAQRLVTHVDLEVCSPRKGFDELWCVGEGDEGRTPVDVGMKFSGLEGIGVEEVDRCTDPVAQNQGIDVAQLFRHLYGQADEVVLANGRDLDRVSIFEVSGV